MKVRRSKWEHFIGVGFHYQKLDWHNWTAGAIYAHLLSGDSTITEECMNKPLLF